MAPETVLHCCVMMHVPFHQIGMDPGEIDQVCGLYVPWLYRQTCRLRASLALPPAIYGQPYMVDLDELFSLSPATSLLYKTLPQDGSTQV